MGVFLVDRTLPGMTEGLLAEAHRLLQGAARRMSSPEHPVRFLRCTYVPEEARCMCLFEANDEPIVRRVNEVAQVPFRRITRAVEFATPGAVRSGGDRLGPQGEPSGNDPVHREEERTWTG
jgi:Protein of unknown function (DUF4242)